MAGEILARARLWPSAENATEYTLSGWPAPSTTRRSSSTRRRRGRFRSAATFATFHGTAPIEVSSGDVVRHRLSGTGDRGPGTGDRGPGTVNSNCCLHLMAIAQIRRDALGRAYYRANASTAKTTGKRCDVRSDSCPTPSTAACSATLTTTTLTTTSRRAREDTRGATTKSREIGSTPTTDSPDKSLPGPTYTNTNTPHQDPLDTERRR
jgi:transposase